VERELAVHHAIDLDRSQRRIAGLELDLYRRRSRHDLDIEDRLRRHRQVVHEAPGDPGADGRGHGLHRYRWHRTSKRTPAAKAAGVTRKGGRASRTSRSMLWILWSRDRDLKPRPDQ